MVTSYQYSAVTEYIEHVHAMINPCDIKKETNWFLYSSCTHVRNIMKLCVVEEMMERGDLRLTDQDDHVSNKQAPVTCHGGIIWPSVSVLTCNKCDADVFSLQYF